MYKGLAAKQPIVKSIEIPWMILSLKHTLAEFWSGIQAVLVLSPPLLMPRTHLLINSAIDLNLNVPSFGKIDVIFLLLLFRNFTFTRLLNKSTRLKNKGRDGLVIEMASQHVIHVLTWFISFHFSLA